MDGQDTPYSSALGNYQYGISVLSASPAGGNGGGDVVAQRLRKILRLKEDELEESKREVAELKEERAKGNLQLQEEMVEKMKESLARLKELEAKEKQQLRGQLQTTQNRAEELAKQNSTLENMLKEEKGANLGKTVEVESLKGTIKALQEQGAKEAEEGKYLISVKDRQIESLNEELEAMQRVQEAESEIIDALTKERVELGEKLLKSNIQEIWEIATNLAPNLINGAKVPDSSTDLGIHPDSMDMTGSSGSEDEIPPTAATTGRKRYYLRNNLPKRSYDEITGSDSELETEEESFQVRMKIPVRNGKLAKRQGTDDGNSGDERDGCDNGDEAEMEPGDLPRPT